MKISVIIPVYNACSFLQRAVDSVIGFNCVFEVILIEDGSTDNSLELCQNIERNTDKVTLYTHTDNANLGAGASRNLGILKSNQKWIAFLDADDYYLSNRFDTELEYFNSNQIFDGIYGRLGIAFENNETKKKFYQKFKEGYSHTSVSEYVDSENLKFVLTDIHQNISGHFSLDTLTVKKNLLLKVGLFNTKLRLHQDTDIIIKLSCLGTLLSGNINNDIAIRWIHAFNRITSDSVNFNSRLLLFTELHHWVLENYDNSQISNRINQDRITYQFLSEHENYSIWKGLIFTFENKLILKSLNHFRLITYRSASSNQIKYFIAKIHRLFVHP